MLKVRIMAYLQKIKNLLLKNKVVVLFIHFHSFLRSSVLGFSIFMLAASSWLAVVRLFQLWLFGGLDYINYYYYSTALSFSFAIFAIIVNYLNKKGYFDRSINNNQKWVNYENLVLTSNNLSSNFLVRKYGFYIIFFILFPFVGLCNSTIAFPFVFTLFTVYFLNTLYIYYYMYKTPVPEDLLLEPSQIYQKIFNNKVISRIIGRRNYSSRSGKSAYIFYTNNRMLLKTCVSVGAVVLGSVFTVDSCIANVTGDTQYVSRAYDRSAYGWSTTSPKARERMRFLEEIGLDSQPFVKDDGRLDIQKVHKAYNDYKKENFDIK